MAPEGSGREPVENIRSHFITADCRYMHCLTHNVDEVARTVFKNCASCNHLFESKNALRMAHAGKIEEVNAKYGFDLRDGSKFYVWLLSRYFVAVAWLARLDKLKECPFCEKEIDLPRRS